LIATDPPVPERRKADFPLAVYATSRQPLLQFAAADQRPATSYHIEWLAPSPTAPRVFGRRENFCQIFRTTFKDGGSERNMWLALERHLDTIEQTLWDGIPSYGMDVHPIGMCGGVLHYLGREPTSADTIRLRPLQDCVLLYNRGDGYPDDPALETHEFLTELSLEVVPPPAIRRG
jgi:hypothetical protein